MSPVDHAWFRMDSPQNLLVVNAVMWTDRPLDDEVLREVVRERLVEEYPKFSQRVEPPSSPIGRPSWVTAEDFDLDRHLLYVALDPPGDVEALQLYVGEQQHVPLDPRHPLWQIHIISGFGTGSAAVFRFHHAIADGMALARVLLSLTDEHPDAGFAPAQRGDRGSWSLRGVGRLVAESVDTVRHPSRLVKVGSMAARDVARLFEMADRPAKRRSVLNGEVGMSKLAVWSDALPLEDFKRVGRASGGTVNDVVVAAIGGAFRRYLEHRGEEPADVPVMVPVDLRPPNKPLPRELGNNFGLFTVELPVRSDSPADRLAQAHERLDELKTSPEGVVSLGVLAGMGLAPSLAEDFVLAFFASKISGVVTNVPGPREPVYLAGAKVEGVIGWVPRGGDMTFGVAAFSYNGAVTVGVSTDESCIPDPEVLLEAFVDELTMLVDRVDRAERGEPVAG